MLISIPTHRLKMNWIRVSTAAKLRGVTRQCIYWHAEQGNLTIMDFDGNKYVDRDEVLKWAPKGKGEYKERQKKPVV